MDGVEPHRRKMVKRYEVWLGPRLLTCSCFDGVPLFGRDWVKREFVEALIRTRRRHGFALLAWVVMPEHVHLAIIPRLPESPVDAVLNMLKSTMSRRVLAVWREAREPVLGRLVGPDGAPHFWVPGGGHDRNVRGDRPMTDPINYIHENPVRRGLAGRATDWPWSSARWYAGLTGEPPEIDDPRVFRAREAARLTERYGSLSAAAAAMKERFGVI